MKKKFVYGIIALLTGITFVNISLSFDVEEMNIFSALEALASGETLPPVDVTCDSERLGWGRCFEPVIYGPIPHPYFECEWTGSPMNYCLEPI